MSERVIIEGDAPPWAQAMAVLLNKIVAALSKRIREPVAPSCTVLTLPASPGAGQLVLVTNEAGGAVLAFYDGAAWRRVTDRAVVS
jgi:hypothetical protein